METSDFDFALPTELIAQTPSAERDASRLLVLERGSGRIHHHRFHEILGFLRPGDVLVFNDSRVIAARLRGKNENRGGEIEILLVEQNAVNDWWAMVRPGKRARLGVQICLLDLNSHNTPVVATISEINADGHRRLRFSGTRDILTVLDTVGEVPLPPYIRRPPRSALPADRDRYQTVYAQPPGSVAAPTAGLHFTQALLERVRARGIETCFVTLHVGPGTFAPVKSETLAGHILHEERFEISAMAAGTIDAACREGRRIIPVGTTSLRTLETAAGSASGMAALSGRTRLFVHPPYDFKIAKSLLTNFHLPRSTLLMLVSAFAAPGRTSGRDLVLSAYAEAIRERYRFFSYGDAMLIL